MSFSIYLFLLLLGLVLLIWLIGDNTPLDRSGLHATLKEAEKIVATTTTPQKRQEQDATPTTHEPDLLTIAPLPSENSFVVQPTVKTRIRELLGNHTHIMVQHKNYNESIKPAKISKGEYLCIITMEAIFNRPFQCVRPKFLASTKSGQPLELDGYNEELQLAVEYNGEHHYNGNHFWWNGDINKFYTQVQNDRYKKEVCIRMGITLLIVHYKVPLNLIPEYIAELLPPEFDPYRKDLLD